MIIKLEQTVIELNERLNRLSVSQITINQNIEDLSLEFEDLSEGLEVLKNKKLLKERTLKEMRGNIETYKKNIKKQYPYQESNEKR